VYYDFTIDSVDLNGRVMSIKWDQKPGAAAFVAGDLVVDIVAQADRTTVLVTPFTTALPVAEGTVQTYFLSPSTAAVALRIKSIANAATDATVVISDVVVGPNVQVQGSAIGNWKSFTPTGTWSTNTTYTGAYREVGSSIEVRCYLALAGAPTSASLAINLPSGFTINTTALQSTSSGENVFGQAGILDAATALYFGQVGYSSTTAVGVFSTSTAAAANINQVSQSLPVTFANGDKIWVTFTVPVNELSSNVTLANRACEEYSFNTSTSTTADDTTSFGYGPGGAAIKEITAALSRRVNFASPIQSTDKIVVELSTDRLAWFPVGARLGTSIVNSLEYDGAAEIGVGLGSVSSTQVDVRFGTYRGSGSIAWGATVGAYFWRVRKVSGGASVGYPISSANIVGRTDGVAPASGMVGEVITGVMNNTALSTGGTYQAASIPLTPGRWLLKAVVSWTFVTAPAVTIEIATISNANNTLGLRAQRSPGTPSSYQTIVVPDTIVDTAANVTYYATINLTFTGGSSVACYAAAGQFIAIRIG
jgi:hypothetical protein